MFHWAEISSGLLFAQEAADGGAAEPSGLNPIFMIVAIVALFFFMILQPERRKRQDAEKMLANLKKNDRVVTIGGIIGVVVSTDKDELTVRVDENNNTRLRILKSAVSRVLDAEKTDAKTEGP